MLKLRMMGTKAEIESFEKFLVNEQTAYTVERVSEMFRNKGTEQNKRKYAEITRNKDDKESEK